RWMIQRSDSTIWIGTKRWDYVRPGIFIYDLKQQKFSTTPASDLANEKFSSPFFDYGCFDNNGRFWIANSNEGIHIINESQQKEVTCWIGQQQKELLKGNNMITDMLVTKSGDVIVGTYQGVMLADEANKQFISMDADITDDVTERAVNSLLEDKQGNIWAARWGSLTRVSPKGEVLNLFTTGFHDLENSGLVEDASGNIWMGNYEGLYCINP